MALSDYEKRVLAEMEQHLRQQDPELADTMASSLPEPVVEDKPAAPKPLSPRNIALGSILAAVGLTVVLVGVGISSTVLTIVLGAAGFLMMVGGVLYALAPASSTKGPAKPSEPTGGPTPQKPRLSREEREEKRRERWENRGSK